MKNNLTYNYWIFKKGGDYFSERQDDFKPIKSGQDPDVEIVNAIKLEDFNENLEKQLDQIVIDAMDKNIEEVRQEIYRALMQEKVKVEV